jgi:hypothetical protein
MNNETSSLLSYFECLICYEPDLISVVTLNCKHQFHMSCLAEWDKRRRQIVGRDTSIYLECPNCMALREIIMINYTENENNCAEKRTSPEIYCSKKKKKRKYLFCC